MFFWKLKKFGAFVTHNNEVSIDHYPVTGTSSKREGEYVEFRHKRLEKYHKIACERIGVKDILMDGG